LEKVVSRSLSRGIAWRSQIESRLAHPLFQRRVFQTFFRRRTVTRHSVLVRRVRHLSRSYLTGEQAHDLAYAFHNLPMEIYGWGTWSVAGTRGRLQYYQKKHSQNPGVDYVALFDRIYAA